MSLRKLLFTGSATVLGLGVVGIPVAALAEDSPATTVPPGPSHTAPTVVESPTGTFTVTLPDFGGLTFGVDPTTGALTGLTVTAASGVIAGAPVLRGDGVEVPFGSTTGEQLEVEVELEHGTPQVTAKVEGAEHENESQREGRGDDNGRDNDADDVPGAPPAAVEENHGDSDHHDIADNDNGDGHGDDNGTSPVTTSVPTLPTVPSTSNRSPGGPPAPSNNQSDGSGSGVSGSNSGSNGSGDTGDSGHSGSDDSGHDNSGLGSDSSGHGDSGSDGSGSGDGGPGH